MASDCVGFTLPGMMELPGSFSGMVISPMPQRGPEASHRTSLAILFSGRRHRLERAVGVHERIVARQRFELIGRGHEGVAAQLRELAGHPHRELGVGIEAGPHRGSAQGQLGEVGQGGLDVLDAVVELGDVARELLAQGQGGGVLQMRPADLHDVGEGLGLHVQRVSEVAQVRNDVVDEGLHRGHAHGGGEDVVRRLAVVDVVVGVDQPFLAALAPEDLAGPVGQDLVHVHVALGAAPGLPDHERELVVVSPRQHLVGRGHDRLPLLLVEDLQVHVHEGGRLLHEREGVEDEDGQPLARDPEVVERALRLRSPEPVGRHLDGSEGVFLGSGLGGTHGSSSKRLNLESLTASAQARMFCTTLPWTSVRRKSRPRNLKVSLVWSTPMRCSRVAWRSWTDTTSSTAK